MPPVPPRYRPLLVAAGLLVLSVAVLGPGLLPGRTLLPLGILGLFEPWRGELPPPANPEVGDAVLQFAQREVKARALAGGQVALWHAGIMAGHPLAGDTQSAPFNPIELVLDAGLPVQRAYSLQVLVQLWLAGLFMVLWIRQLGAGWFPALAGGLVWMLAGYHQVWRSYVSFVATPLWLPAVAAAWEHAARTGARRGVVLGGLAAGMAILGGQLQFAIFGALVLLAYACGRLAGFDAARRRRGARAGIVTGGLGLAVAAVHLLPTIEMARDGIRVPFSISALIETAVPLRQLVTLIAPRFLGDPRTGDYHGAQSFSEMAMYLGLIPLLVVLTAPLLVARPAALRPYRRDVWLLAGIAALVALVVLGSPLAWPLAFVPGLQWFGLMRWLAVWPLLAAPLVALGLAAAAAAPRRFAGLVAGVAACLALALLAAAWVDPEGAGTAVPTLAGLALSTAVLVFWSRRPERPARQGLVLAVIAADLLWFGWGFTPASPVDAFPPVPPLDRLVEERAAEAFRVAVLQPDQIALGPGVAPSLGIDEIGGYTSTPRASFRAFVDRLSRPTGNPFLAANRNMIAPGRADPRLLALLNVRYLLSATPLEPFDPPLDLEAGCRETVALAPGAALGTAVRAWANGFNRIDVAVPRGGPVAVHLVPAPGAAEHLAYGELAAGDGPLRTLYFEPIADSAGRSFYAYVDQPAGAAGPPPEVCANGGVLVAGTAATEPAFAPVFDANGLHVYRAPEPPGRAWIVRAARAAASQAEALDAVAAAGFDPRAEVVVEPGPNAVLADLVPPGQAPQLPPQSPPQPPRDRPKVAVADDGPNARRIALEAPAGGWLVVSEAYAPGWRATVDGRAVPVLRADGGIQALQLPPGSRRVDLSYRPWSVVAGVWITLAGLLVALGIALWPARWRRRAERAAHTLSANP